MKIFNKYNLLKIIQYLTCTKVQRPHLTTVFWIEHLSGLSKFLMMAMIAGIMSNGFVFSQAIAVKELLSYPDKFNNKDRKSTRLNSSHIPLSRMPSSA